MNGEIARKTPIGVGCYMARRRDDRDDCWATNTGRDLGIGPRDSF